MKQSHIVLALLALFAGFRVQALALNANPATVSLGAAGNFTILAKTAISSAVGSGAGTWGTHSAILGDVGISPAAASLITVDFMPLALVTTATTQYSTSAIVTGKVYAGDYTPASIPPDLSTAVTNMGTAYTDAYGRTPGDIVAGASIDMNTAQTLTRGVYNWTTVVNINADVILSGSATDVFIFEIAQDLNIATGIKVTMAGGAVASNVFWAVAGTTTLLANSELAGTILGSQTIALLDSAVLHGKALGQTDVTLIDNKIDSAAPVVSTPTDTATASPTDSPTPTDTPTVTGTPTDSPTTSATPTVTPSASITRTSTSTPTATTISTPASEVNLGTAGYYGVLASTFSLAGGITTIAGDAGFTTLAGPGTHTLTGTNRMPPPAQAGLDQNAALAALNGMTCTYTFATGAIDLASNSSHLTGIYTPGVYCVDGAMSIGESVAGIVTLNGKGTYVFRSTGAFNMTIPYSKVLLTGGADACDVFWVPGAATTLAANTVFKGTIIDNSGITVGTGTIWQGRALAYGGTITMTADTITALSCDAVAAGVYTGPNAPTSGKSFVYPSPARGDTVKVVYTMLESGKAEIRIYNENGDLVTRTEETKSAGPRWTQIPINSFAPGIYLYKIILSYDSGNADRMNVQKFAVIK